jgi:hypothetical protein
LNVFRSRAIQSSLRTQYRSEKFAVWDSQKRGIGLHLPPATSRRLNRYAPPGLERAAGFFDLEHGLVLARDGVLPWPTKKAAHKVYTTSYRPFFIRK